jgi:hypothetical protein
LPFSVFPITWPASVLNDRFEGNPNKEGKEFVKFVDGLTNVATKHDGWHILPSIAVPPERVH